MNALNHDTARDLLHALIDGELSAAEERELQAHVAACSHCELDLSELKAASAAVRRLRPPVDAGEVAAVRHAVRSQAAAVQPGQYWKFNLPAIFPQFAMVATAGVLMLALGAVLLQTARSREAARGKMVMARIEEQPALAPEPAAPAATPASAPAAAAPSPVVPAPAPGDAGLRRSRADRPAAPADDVPRGEADRAAGAGGFAPAPAETPAPGDALSRGEKDDREERSAANPAPPAPALDTRAAEPPRRQSTGALRDAAAPPPEVAAKAAPVTQPAPRPAQGRAAGSGVPAAPAAPPPTAAGYHAPSASATAEEMQPPSDRYSLAPRVRVVRVSPPGGGPADESARGGAASADAKSREACRPVAPEFPAFPGVHPGDRERMPLAVRVTLDGAGRVIRVKPLARPNQMPLAIDIRNWLTGQQVHPVICDGAGVETELEMLFEWPE